VLLNVAHVQNGVLTAALIGGGVTVTAYCAPRRRVLLVEEGSTRIDVDESGS
jgi:hypothetical protein